MASNDLELALRIRAAFEGQQALTNLATSFVDINKKVETLMRGLQAISGSAEGAAKEFTYLEETSKKFGLSVIDLADNYVKLSASAKETNLEGEATRKLFEATSATMAVLGGDTITTERAFRALGQIMSKGQVYAEELKGQLAEAIPGALQIMSRGLGISTNEMLRLMEAGQLSADVLLPFATQLEKEYGNLASSSTTFAQAINRIQTEWTLLTKQLGDTGAFKALSNTMEFVGNNASVMAGAIGSFATVGLVMLGKGLVSVVGGLTSYVTATRFAANATQQAAVATLAKAEADAQAALAARSNTQAALLSAQANEVAMRGTQLHALAVRELALAQAQATIASNNYVAATKSIQVAQTALIASQGLLSKAWALITGPAGLIALTVLGFAAMTAAFRGQDEATKTLSKSTEEYAEELDKLTAAQINLVNARAKEQAADNQSRINTIKEELEFLYKKIDAERQGIEVNREKSISWYGFKNVLSSVFSTEEQLAQAQADLDEATQNLTITEAKRSIGIGALANQYLLLQKTTQEQQASLNDVNRDWLEQNKIVDSSKQTYLDLVNLTGLYSTQTIDAHKNVGQAVEGLQAIEQKRKDQLLLSKNTQTQITTAIEAYAEELGVSADVVRAGISGDQQAINQLDAKSKAIALSVQSLLRLTDEEKALAAQIRLTKAELEKYEKVQLSGVEAKLREAAAIGDLNALRQAEIEKAKVQQTVAQKSLELEQTILSDKQKQLAIDEQLYQQNEKGRPKTQERIDKLKLEITAQEGVVAQKQADIAATAAQAAAVERANTLVGSALAQQQQALMNTQNELAELQAAYERLSSSGESITVLNGLLEQMRKKQAEVAQQTDTMRADMVAAFAAVGLSYEEVMTGMDFETRRQIDAFGELGEQAKVTSGDLQNAFTHVLAKANTVAELDELARTLESLGSKGEVAGDQVAVGLAAIDLKAAELVNSLGPVQQSLEKLGVGVPERLAAIAQQNEVLYTVIKKSKAPIDEVDKAFLKYAESQLLAAEHGAKVDVAVLKNEASTRGLSAAFAELQRKLAEVDPEIAALVEAMDRYNTMVQRTNALNEQQREVNNQVIESQKGIAEIIGDKNAVAQEEAKLAAQAVQDSIQRINDLEEENDALDGLIQKLIEKQQAEGLNPEETDSLQQYQDEAQARQLVIDKANEELLLKQKIAEQAALEAGPLGEAVRLTESAANAINVKVAAMEKELEMSLKLQKQNVTDEQQDLDLLEADKELLGVAKEGLEAELEKAVAEKDVDQQNEIRLKIADNLIKQAEQEVKIAEQKVEVAKELVAMSKAEQQAAIEKAEAYREAQAEQERLLESTRALAEASDGLNEEEKEQLANIEARIAGLKSQAISEDAAADVAQAAIEQGQKQVEITQKSVDAARKRVEAAKAEKEALEDQIEAQDKDTDSKNKNTKSTQSNTSAKEKAKDAAEELAQQLEELKKKQEEEAKAAEEAAQAERERLKAMKEAAEEAQRQVDTLKSDLLKETGFDQEADLLSQMVDYQTKRERLAKAIEEAEGAGNKALVDALNQQLSLIDKINDAKVKNINDNYAQERADRELEATQKMADATQKLTDVMDEAANERLSIEAEHLEAIDALNEQSQADHLAQVEKNQSDLHDAESEYAQDRKDNEQTTDDDIQSLREEHQQTLLDLEKDYQASVLEEQANLTKALADENQDSADAVQALYGDAADRIKDLNRDVAKDLQDVTKDLAKDLKEVADDLVKAMADATSELDRDFAKADQESTQKIDDVYADLDKSILNRQQDTQDTLTALAKDRSESIADLHRETAEATKDQLADYQDDLLDISEELTEKLAESSADLAKSVQEENESLADQLQDLTKETTQSLADLAKEVQKDIQETNNDLAKTIVEVNDEAAQSVLDLNADTSQSLEALYANSRDEVARIQQDFADNTQALSDQFVQDALDATQTLADKSEDMRRTLLGEQGESGQVVDAEFGDELQALAKLYAESGDGAKESFTTAIEQAKELYSLQLDEMLKSGDLSKQQYSEAKASMEERLSLTQQLIDEEKAVLAEEQNAARSALSADRDQRLAQQQADTEAQRQQINEESALKSAAIQQEKNEKISAAHEEQVEKLRLIEEERLAKALSIQEEAELKQQEAQAESAERQTQLQEEFAERQVKLQEESNQKRIETEKDHQQALANIQEELQKKLAANAIEFADRQQKARDEESEKIAEDQQKATEKVAGLADDLVHKKQLLQEEYELERLELQQLAVEKRAELEQEVLDKKAAISEEKAEKLLAIDEETTYKKAQLAEELKASLLNIGVESQERLARLAEEYRLKQEEEQQVANEDLAKLQKESDARLAILSQEFQAKRKVLQDEQALALRSIDENYQAELLILNQQTQAKLSEAKKKADQSVLLAQENIQTIQQQIEFELALARTKDLQAESQVRLNASMKETLTLTKGISEQMRALASSSLSGLSQQASDLNKALRDIEVVL